MKKITTILLFFFVTIALNAAQTLKVVATTPELASIASSIGEQAVKIRTICSGKEDPHFLQAKPSFMVSARNADLWIRNGLDLEVGWEPVLLEGCGNPKIQLGQKGHFDSGAFIAYVLEVPSIGTTRASGDVHPGGNPHYMTDPLQARTIAITLTERLIKNDPYHTDEYKTGLKKFLKKMDIAMFGEELVNKTGGERLWKAESEGKLHQLLNEENCADLLSGWKGVMLPWEGRNIIAFHKSFNYFAHRFKLNIVEYLEPLPGVPPTPVHLAKLVEIVKEQDVRLVLKEPFYPMKPALVVRNATGIRIAEVSSYATDSSSDGYFQFMESLISIFKEI